MPPVEAASRHLEEIDAYVCPKMMTPPSSAKFAAVIAWNGVRPGMSQGDATAVLEQAGFRVDSEFPDNIEGRRFLRFDKGYDRGELDFDRRAPVVTAVRFSTQHWDGRPGAEAFVHSRFVLYGPPQYACVSPQKRKTYAIGWKSPSLRYSLDVEADSPSRGYDGAPPLIWMVHEDLYAAPAHHP